MQQVVRANMQQVDIRINEFYGDNLLTLEFPDEWEIHKVDMTCVNTPPMTNDDIIHSLDNTLGSPNVSEQARGKKGKVVITCDDLSRPTPAGRVFPFIVDQLHEAGISDRQIFILGSFGCHCPMNLDDYARKLGDDAVAKYDCVNHNPFEHFENLGRTSKQTPILINKEFASADLRICISGIKRHNGAGAGGGGKAVLPGVSSIESIQYNHRMIEDRRPRKRSIWWIKDNPERQDMQEYARKANLNVSINCVYNGQRQLIDLSAGDVDDAWREAVRNGFKAHDSRTAPKSDVVVMNSYPQSDQNLDWWGAKESLSEGGTAIIVHHYPLGIRLQHYHSERMGAPWRRMQGYKRKRWPVEQADNIIVYTNRLSKRVMLGYDERVEWTTDWNYVLQKLKEIHGTDASVAIYKSVKLQFDGEKNPLDI